MQLLEDVFIIENLQILSEGQTGPMRVKGCFQRADEENNNKRIYSKPLLEREITKLAEAITERRLMGELDHPQHDSVKLSNVSHLVTGLSMKGNEVIGEAEILDTPAGKVAQALIRGGVKVGISSRGMGTVSEDVHGKRHVNEDFRLITWDLVADPSTRGAFPGLTESTQIQEIIDTVYPEAHKVKNFTTLLKESLNERRSRGGRGSVTEPRNPITGGTSQTSSRKRTILPGQKDYLETHDKYPSDLPSRSGGRVSKSQFRKTMKVRARAKTPKERKWKSELSMQARVVDSTSLADLVRSKLYEIASAPTPLALARKLRLEKEARMRKRKGIEKTFTPEPKAQNDSTSLADLVRSRLEEKTRLQKETEKKVRAQQRAEGKPETGVGVATFKATTSRRGHDTEDVKVRSYKASVGKGMGSQAQKRAKDMESEDAAVQTRALSKGDSPEGSKAQRQHRSAMAVRRVRMDRNPWRGAISAQGGAPGRTPETSRQNRLEIRRTGPGTAAGVGKVRGKLPK